MPKQTEFDALTQMYFTGSELIQMGHSSTNQKMAQELIRNGAQLVNTALPKLSTVYFDEFCGTVPRRPLIPFPGWPVWEWPTIVKGPKPDPIPFKQLGKYDVMAQLDRLKAITNTPDIAKTLETTGKNIIGL